MSSKSLFPWEVLKAECLRTVCSQLVQSTGAHYSEVRRREDMISFLNDVEKQGLDEAAETLLESLKNEVKPPRPVSTPGKRKAEHTDDEEYKEDNDESDAGAGYNTRYKGVKRVKVHATRFPRKRQATSARVAVSESAESTDGTDDTESPSASASAAPPVKRGRGRPRKSVVTVNLNAAEGTSEEGAAATAAESASAPPPVKRGRGRPRKSVVSAAEDTLEGDAAATAESASAPPPVKRGRGRPRKSIPNDVGAATSSVMTGGSVSVAENNEVPSALGSAPKRGRGRPRKSEAMKSEPVTVSVKRPRGRPRKNPLPAPAPTGTSASAAAAKPISKSKEVFDGVLMPRRAGPSPTRAAEEDRGGEDEDDDAAEEDGEDTDPVLRNGHLDDGGSSLAGSNKENEPMFDNYTPDRDTQDADAQGDSDPSTTQEAATAVTVQTVDNTQSAVIMPTIPMALAAAASNSNSSAAPPPDAVQPSAPQDRPALQPL